MKIFIFALIILVGSLCSPAGSFRLEGLEGKTYQPSTNVEIAWAATNELPRGLWVYKVIPQTFSMAVVTNLMAIGGFEWKNLVKSPKSRLPDKDLFCFRDKKEYWTRCLTIAPTIGWIEYFANDTDSKAPVEDVPSKVEVEKLALDVLFQMGIDRSLLCYKRNGYETIAGKLSRDGQKLTTNVVSRGISYDRQIDGVRSGGIGFYIDFESHAKITRFWLEWRNLLPYAAHPTLTTNQIIDEIKAGHAIGTFSEDLSGLDQVKKLTVVKMTPYYFDDELYKPFDFTYPYAELELVADFGNTNTTTLYLQCPILSTNAFAIGTQTH
jgi:hypothetical protein